MDMTPFSTRWAHSRPDPDEWKLTEDMTSGLGWNHTRNLSCFTSVLVPLPVATPHSFPFSILDTLQTCHFYSDSSWELFSTSLHCSPHSFLTLFPTQTLSCSKECRYLIILKYCYLCSSQIFLGLDWTSAQHHMSSADIILLKSIDRSSSVVQWLRLCGCTAEGTVSIPVWGTLISCQVARPQKKKSCWQKNELQHKPFW